MKEMEQQYQHMFFTRPRQTHIVRHDIKSPPGTIVKEQPYRVPEACSQVFEKEVE